MLSSLEFSAHARGAVVLFGLAAAGCASGAKASRSDDGSARDGSAPTSAHTPASAADERLADGWGLVIHSAGLAAMLDDPRDAGLLRALGMLDERLLELPAELGGGAPPPGSMEFLCEALSAPWTLQLDLDESHGHGPDESMPVSVRATWTVHAGSAERAAALEARCAGLLALVPLPSTGAEDDPELTEVETPMGRLFHGARAKSGTFVLAWGEPAKEEVRLAALGFPQGVAPVFALDVELSELVSPFRHLLEQAGPEAQVVTQQLEALGLLGQDAFGFSFAAGHGSDRAHYRGRYRNWVPMARRTGALVSTPIPREELRLVPADATLVSLSRSEPTSILQTFEMFGTEAEAAVLAQVREALGLELGADVLEPLGQTFGFYLSDTTGGGGLASAVAFVALDDETRMATTLERLASRLNEHADAMLDGRARVRSFEHEGSRCLALTFPGLPVPLEPTLAIHAEHLFVAATPQTLFAALEHARGRGQGLPSHAGLRALSLGSLDDLQGLFFSDAPRLARDGYGMLGLAASALANAVRSKTDALREPGLVLPSYHELLEGARPTLVLSRIQGEDLVLVGQGDRSAQLHLAATLGWAPAIVAGFAGMGALAATGVDGDEPMGETTQETQAQTDIWTLDDALEQYALANDGLYPPSLEALVTPDENGVSYLGQDALPLDPWGNSYVYELRDEAPLVISYGADGVPGGEGPNTDLDNSWYESDEEMEWEELEMPEEFEELEPEEDD
ncbi:MAG: hypothetical protein HOP15_13820 [Planctomycetes bacterium]|nr:hypothetical protein [Planctomycetota bacterium]